LLGGFCTGGQLSSFPSIFEDFLIKSRALSLSLSLSIKGAGTAFGEEDQVVVKDNALITSGGSLGADEKCIGQADHCTLCA
jgi:hypothetical protein